MPHTGRMRTARLLLVGLLALILTLAACTGKDAVDQGSGQFRYVSGTQLGKVYPVNDRKPAGSFTGDLLSGGAFSSSQLAGKVTVINFWATWCPPCVTETPQYDLVYRQYHPKNVDFVGIDTKDERSNAQSFVRNNDISYPMVFDQTGSIALDLGHIPTVALPITVVLDKQGRVAGVYALRLQAKDVENVLNQLLAEH